MTVQELISQLQNADKTSKVMIVGSNHVILDLQVVNIKQTQTDSYVTLTTNSIQSTLDEEESTDD